MGFEIPLTNGKMLGTFVLLVNSLPAVLASTQISSSINKAEIVIVTGNTAVTLCNLHA
jgi:hypothetical protein